MKPILKLGFTDTFGGVINFFSNILSERYSVIRDDTNPDYLIFGDKNFGNNNVNFNDKNCVKIFYTGENAHFWDYQCHFGISFDHFDNERHYRLPLYVIYDYENRSRGVPHAGTWKRTENDLTEEKGFCSFVVKNPGCEMRNRWFHRLNSYKTVASAGPLFNNVGYTLDTTEDAVKTKMSFIPKFKFNLCFENSSWPGYATEKLYEALCGNTVPIYWGSPTIEVDFNRKAFLNWHDYKDDDAFFDAIKRVNEDGDLYREMYLQPMFNDHSNSNKFMDLELFKNWFDKNVYRGVLNG